MIKVRMVPEEVAQEAIPILKEMAKTLASTAEAHANWDSSQAQELKEQVLSLQFLLDYIGG